MMHFEIFKSTSRQSKRYQFTNSSPWSSNLKLYFTTTKSSTFSGPPWRDWQEGGTETRDASTIPVMICGWHLYFGCTCKEVTFQWRHQDYLQSISNFGCLFLRNNTVLLDRRHGCWLKRFQYVLIIFQFFGNISQHYLNNKTFTFQLCPLTLWAKTWKGHWDLAFCILKSKLSSPCTVSSTTKPHQQKLGKWGIK